MSPLQDLRQQLLLLLPLPLPLRTRRLHRPLLLRRRRLPPLHRMHRDRQHQQLGRPPTQQRPQRPLLLLREALQDLVPSTATWFLVWSN